MKKLFVFILFTTHLFSQNTSSLKKAKIKDNLFLDYDIALIDSLLLQSEQQSPLYDTSSYFIKNVLEKEVKSVSLNTKILKERLEKINARTPFNLSYNPLLEQTVKSYLKYRKRSYPALMAKALYYFPMFEKYLDAYNIPLEMKYLAIVESALDPKAKSYVGATGLWQFMYTTGLQYNLKVSSYVDERQNPVRATEAACKYLSDLYKIFQDWDLVLAAYNSGPGNVLKAIKRSGGHKNYWNIRPYLPTETANYVPAFYATMYLFEYQNEHNLIPEKPLIRHFETDTIQVKQLVTFEQIAAKTNLNFEMIQFLNPSYKLEIIPFIEGKNYALRLPRKNTLRFIENEKNIYELANTEAANREKPLPKYFELGKRIRYKVRSGDYLGKIANKFGVRVSDLKKWNRLKSTSLKIGQRLTVYPKR
jgi:membrane-bound lytic murein transglycosylase D